MTLSELVKKADFGTVTLPDPDKEISGVYIGDLLSWVMGRAEVGNVWITIMSNVNVVAVASLADVSCILLAEGVDLDQDADAAARAKGINVIKTEMSAYDAAIKIGGILG